MSQIQTPAMHRMLPTWLRRLFIPSCDEAALQAAGRYEAAFVAAQARSILWGLRPPSMEMLPVRYASASAISAVRWELHRSVGHLSGEVVAAQRFGVTAAVRVALEGALRVPLTYTLGYVSQSGQRLCHTPIQQLEQMLRLSEEPRTHVRLHAWLTLPSHEVIDVSFWALYPELSCAEEREMRSLFMHPDQMPGRAYCPQWAGDQFVRQIGILKEYEGW